MRRTQHPGGRLGHDLLDPSADALGPPGDVGEAERGRVDVVGAGEERGFGERVEDFFQLTDENDLPLDADARQRLGDALVVALDPDLERNPA